MTDVEILTRRVCETCEGDGVIYRPSCQVCSNVITKAEIAAGIYDAPGMPCGHGWQSFIEKPTCHDCNGTGKIEEWAVMTGATFRRAT